MTETQIAVTEKDVGTYIEQTLPALVKSYAVRSYNAETWMKTAALCIVENPDLMACLATDAGRISLKHALRFAATTGLSLNPQEGKAALVPIQGKVNYWIEKNGIVDLVLDTGVVRHVYGDSVKENDRFKITKGIHGDDYEHIPALKGRGQITGFYSAILEKDGTGHVYYMTRQEVEAHRDKYGKGLDKKGSAWNTSFEGMGVKTVIKLNAARLRLAPEKMQVLAKAQDFDGETVPTSFEVPAEKGASAAEVEAKLKAQAEQKPTEQAPAASPGPAPATDSAHAPAASAAPAGAPAASVAPGAPGSAPEQPELGLPGGAPKDIF
jgi:phage RecT family recombinase